jgi:hypothetical protein
MSSRELHRPWGAWPAIAAAFLFARATHAQVLYVDDDAPMGGDGASWDTALRSLQMATDLAAKDGAINEIRVGQGLYKPGDGGNGPLLDPNKTFTLRSELAIRGGFLGLGAGKGRDPDERNIELYKTVLSGDLKGDDDIDPELWPFFILNTEENSLHIVTATGVDETAVLDGVEVRQGGPPPAEDFGGGVVIDGSPTIVSCTFRFNITSAVRINAGSPTIDDCRFIQNVISGGGGAIGALFAGTVTVTNCHFEENFAATRGGAIGIHMCELVVEDSTFAANVSQLSAGGAIVIEEGAASISGCSFDENDGLSFGGAIASFGTDLIVDSCLFDANIATEGIFATSGGGIAAMPGDTGVGSLRVFDSTFAGNKASLLGGGLANGTDDAIVRGCRFELNLAPNCAGFINQNAMTMIDCDFVLNVAQFSGGGGCSTIGDLTMIDCRFFANEADVIGGGIHLSAPGSTLMADCLFAGNRSGGSGGAISSANGAPGSLSVVNCTMHDNQAAAAGAIYADDSPVVRGSVLWGNAPDQVPPGLASVEYSLVEGGYPGAGNIDLDPLFADPDGPDGNPNTFEDNDYSLAAGSPAIDAGNSDALPPDTFDIDADGDVVEPLPLDLAGAPRRVDDPATRDTGVGAPPIVDMGAYEFQAAGCPADFNADGVLNILDFVAFQLAWVAQEPAADCDANGAFNILDFVCFQQLFQAGCS